MTLIVQKYGGTAVGSPDRVRDVARRVAARSRQGERIVVVTSAMGDTTDALLALAASVAPGAATRRRRELDLILATGEQTAAALLALALEELGVPAVSLTGAQAEIRTDHAHSAARILAVGARRVRRALEEGRIPVIAGFQGLSDDCEITTLGRGGSDTTAVALALALGAERCEIYTDVDGIYSADPRRVAGVVRYTRLTHAEALRLALAGAAVLHPRAAALAAQHGLPLRILSAFADGPEHGTSIEGEVDVEGPRILGIAADGGSARLVVDGLGAGARTTAAVLSALAEAEIPIEHLEEERAPDGGRRISAIIGEAHAAAAVEAVRRAVRKGSRALACEGISVRADGPIARVTIVGTGLSGAHIAFARALDRLAAQGIEPDGVGFNELGLRLYVPPEHADATLRILHAALIEEGVGSAARFPGLAAGRETLERRPA